MDISGVAAATGVSLTIIIQMSIFAFWLGKLSQRQISEKEIVGIKFKNNTQEHNHILVATEKHTEILEEVQECIHKMQGGREC